MRKGFRNRYCTKVEVLHTCRLNIEKPHPKCSLVIPERLILEIKHALNHSMWLIKREWLNWFKSATWIMPIGLFLNTLNLFTIRRVFMDIVIFNRQMTMKITAKNSWKLMFFWPNDKILKFLILICTFFDIGPIEKYDDELLRKEMALKDKQDKILPNKTFEDVAYK